MRRQAAVSASTVTTGGWRGRRRLASRLALVD
jgi:hypothetical protein